MNSHTVRGDTALIAAVENRYHESVELLLKARADMEKKHHNGYCALTRAASSGDHKSLELLIQAGANVNVCSANETSALLLAASRSYKMC